MLSRAPTLGHGTETHRSADIDACARTQPSGPGHSRHKCVRTHTTRAGVSPAIDACAHTTPAGVSPAIDACAHTQPSGRLRRGYRCVRTHTTPRPPRTADTGACARTQP